jgi:aspartyl-tRNA(Asn)/glutamyl-tRNA(Gln) amidotransferase subunit C
MRISAETVLELADLARLRLDPEEVERMRRDLDAILGYVEKLSELDTTQVPPTAHVLDISTPLRLDRVAGVLPVKEVVRNAPQHDESSMIVPKVIE